MSIVKEKREIKLGSIITVDGENRKQYVVIHRDNEKFICLRIIAENGRTLDHRYLEKLDDDKLVLLDGARTVKREEINEVGDSCSVELLEKLKRQYKLRLKRSKVKVKQIQKRPYSNPVDNGLNPGNAWNCIKSVEGFIKVYRG